MLRAAVPRQAAFFLQQAVEKIGKALLVAEGVNPARIHAIGQLAAELPERHPCRERLVDLDRLTIHATLTRYPSPAGDLPPAPSAEEIARDLQAVEELLAQARAQVGLPPVQPSG